MPTPAETIANIRDAVCGVVRVAATGTPGANQIAFVGTAWCAAPGIFVTAHHILNDAQPRDPNHKFFVLRAVGNGVRLERWPILGFLLEDPVHDFAVVKAPPPPGISVPSIPLSAALPADGTPVLTYGCPVTMIHNVVTSPALDILSINAPIFTHANIGIVAAQYRPMTAGPTIIEFNVRWYHGESGGPVVRTDTQISAVAIMQRYRNIPRSNGADLDGPRFGMELTSMHTLLTQHGAVLV